MFPYCTTFLFLVSGTPRYTFPRFSNNFKSNNVLKKVDVLFFYIANSQAAYPEGEA